MIAPSTGKAFAVLFQELRRWSVNSFYTVSWKWPADTIKPLATALDRKTVLLDKKTIDSAEIVLVSLHFDGEMESRATDTDGFKGRLFVAETGDVIYSKIDVRHGAIGVVPDSLPRIAVSSEYPVYRVRPDSALPEYVKLLFRTRAFRRQINTLISGASGRKRVQPSDLEEIEVPLPSPEVQAAIVNYWNRTAGALADARAALAESIEALNDRLRDLYNHEAAQDVIHARYFALDFKDLDAWDAKSGRASAFRLACPSFRPMGEFIEEATEMVRPFDDPEKERPVYGVNNKDGIFLNGHQKGDSFNAPYKRIQKDWFFHNPTRCNVGSLGIVPEVPEDAITSPEYQVWRLKKDVPEPLLAEYVAMLIQTPFFLELVQFNRVGAVKQRMYTENLCQLRIPYLPLTEQRRFASARNKAVARLAKARERLEVARQEVEEMIIGTREIPK